MKKELLALSERYLPYTLYRYIMILYQRVTVRNKECSYEDEYFLKWRPFSKKKYCIIRVEFPVHSVFVAAKRYILLLSMQDTMGCTQLWIWSGVLILKKGF